MDSDDKDIERLRQLAAERRDMQIVAKTQARAAQSAADEAVRRAGSVVALAPKLAQQLRSKGIPMATFEIVKNKKVLWRYVSEHVVVMQGWTFATHAMRGFMDRVNVSGFVLASDGTIHSINIQHVTLMPGAAERYLIWTMGHSSKEIAEQKTRAVPALRAERTSTDGVRKLEAGLAELVAKYDLVL